MYYYCGDLGDFSVRDVSSSGNLLRRANVVAGEKGRRKIVSLEAYDRIIVRV